jgi:hypothetical protein
VRSISNSFAAISLIISARSGLKVLWPYGLHDDGERMRAFEGTGTSNSGESPRTASISMLGKYGVCAAFVSVAILGQSLSSWEWSIKLRSDDGAPVMVIHPVDITEMATLFAYGMFYRHL